MKISLQEVDRIRHSPAPLEDRDAGTDVLPLPTVATEVLTRSEEVQAVKDRLAEMPESREDIVAELKARIEQGEYHPTGEEIADLMIRRSLADRIR